MKYKYIHSKKYYSNKKTIHFINGLFFYFHFYNDDYIFVFKFKVQISLTKMKLKYKYMSLFNSYLLKTKNTL